MKRMDQDFIIQIYRSAASNQTQDLHTSAGFLLHNNLMKEAKYNFRDDLGKGHLSFAEPAYALRPVCQEQISTSRSV